MCERSHKTIESQIMPANTPSILAFGDNIVDCYTALNIMFPGGSCLNVAAFARRFGASAAYAGAVADDAAGRLIRMALAKDVSMPRYSAPCPDAPLTA